MQRGIGQNGRKHLVQLIYVMTLRYRTAFACCLLLLFFGHFEVKFSKHLDYERQEQVIRLLYELI